MSNSNETITVSKLLETIGLQKVEMDILKTSIAQLQAKKENKKTAVPSEPEVIA